MSSLVSGEEPSKAPGVHDANVAAYDHEDDTPVYQTSDSRKQIGLISAIFLCVVTFRELYNIPLILTMIQ